MKTWLLSICTLSTMLCADISQDTDAKQKEVQKISEAFGHLMGKNLESLGVHFDVQAVIKGLQDSAAGQASPMSEMECIKAITEAQEIAFKALAEENLTKANRFLLANQQETGTILLEEGKIQYRIEKTGSGANVLQDSTPLVRYKGSFLDGSVFGESLEDEPLAMEDVIPGLKLGMQGMQKGEKRAIFIHPDYAYGVRGSLPPNSLIRFDVEIIDLQPSSGQKEKQQAPDLHSPEIALPETSCEALR